MSNATRIKISTDKKENYILCIVPTYGLFYLKNKANGKKY